MLHIDKILKIIYNTKLKKNVRNKLRSIAVIVQREQEVQTITK